MKKPYDILADDIPDGYREIADIIGVDAAVALAEARGGDSVYVPMPEMITRKARNRAIRAEFNGCNYRHLARRYNLTVTMIRQILGAHKTGVDIYDAQVSLPGF